MLQKTSMLPNVGDLIEGKYRVLGEIGRGGMSIVLEAEHVELREVVAIKILLPEHSFNPDAAERFAREARAAAKIKSEHVAHIYDVGQLPSGLPFIVMERLRGGDLAQLILDRGKLGLALTVELMLQLASALEEAHRIGIVHRDLKPANLFIGWDRQGRPTLKLIDFGISKTPPDDRAANVTQAGYLFGSPDYMSPEQVMDSHSVDTRSDIWALGVILVECLTTELPFVGSSPQDLYFQIVHGQARLPSSLDPALPAAVDAIVLGCLQRDPAARIQSVVEWAALLLKLRSDTPSSIHGFSSEPPTGLTSARTVPPSGDVGARPGIKLWLAVACFAVLFLFALLRFTARSHPEASGGATPPIHKTLMPPPLAPTSVAVPATQLPLEESSAVSAEPTSSVNLVLRKPPLQAPIKNGAVEKVRPVQDDELFNEPR